MYCVRNVTEDLYWVGANDRRLTLFENIHPIPRGVSYNSYLLLDEKTVLFDTVDWSGCREFLDNVKRYSRWTRFGLSAHQSYGAGSCGFYGGSASALSGV